MEIVVVIFILIFIGSLLVRLSQNRYSGPGETNSTNMADYGPPAKSLYTSTEIFTLHHRIEITDENEKAVYRAETQFPSIHDKTDVYSADGRHIAYMERKLVTLHEIRYVDMDNGKKFTLSNELLHIIRDVTNIEGLGWILEGNIIQLNFTIKDADGGLIAVVSQKAFSLHDKYVVDIYKTEHEEEVVAILVALQHMISERQSAAASSGGGSSS